MDIMSQPLHGIQCKKFNVECTYSSFVRFMVTAKFFYVFEQCCCSTAVVSWFKILASV